MDTRFVSDVSSDRSIWVSDGNNFDVDCGRLAAITCQSRVVSTTIKAENDNNIGEGEQLLKGVPLFLYTKNDGRS